MISASTIPATEQEPDNASKLSKEQFDELFPMLCTLRAAIAGTELKYYIIQFSGSGDSGQVDDTYFAPDEDAEWSGDTGQPAIDSAIKDNIQDFFVNDDKFVGWDWYNNEGGAGKIVIDIMTGRIVVSGYWRESVSHDVDVAEWKL